MSGNGTEVDNANIDKKVLTNPFWKNLANKKCPKTITEFIPIVNTHRRFLIQFSRRTSILTGWISSPSMSQFGPQTGNSEPGLKS